MTAEHPSTLTDAECGQIVRASLDRDRVLGGPGVDVLLTTVDQVVSRHVAAAVRRTRITALREAAAAYPTMLRDMVSRGSVARWLLDRADTAENADDTGTVSVDDVARTLIAAWERAEGTPVNASYVATHADMARALLAEYDVLRRPA